MPEHSHPPARPGEGRRGPWHQRALTVALSVIYGVLLFWLLGFLVNDLGRWPAPDYAVVERSHLDPLALDSLRGLQQQRAQVGGDIDAAGERQATLRDSTASAETTLHRLLDLQRLSIENSRPWSASDQQSLERVKALFLRNQEQYQTINQELAGLQRQRRALESQIATLDTDLDRQRATARADHQAQRERHAIRMAALQLALLAPLMVVVAVLWWRGRHSLYAPLLHATAIAVAMRVGLVMHQHFPQRYSRYVLVLVFLGVVIWALVALLRRLARPDAGWLLRRYREAYEHQLCPLCEYPMRRGPLRYLMWTRRSARRLPATQAAQQAEEPYTCPVCATTLFEACGACGDIRPALLPACTHCGDTLPTATVLARAGAGLGNHARDASR